MRKAALRALAGAFVLASSCARPGAPGHGSERPATVTSAPAAVDLGTYLSAFREGANAYQAGHFNDALAPFQRALAASPHNDVLVYFLARASLQTKDTNGALRWLQRLTEEGSDLVPTPDRFPGLAARPEFEEVVSATSRASRPASAEAMRIDEPGLLAEGIAYDAATGLFYVGSERRRKIVRLAPGIAPTDFVKAQDQEMDAPQGLRVDSKRRTLWAATHADEGQDGFTPDAAGRSALLAFDLETGARRAMFPLPRSEPHELNDLVVDDDGGVYVTDSEAGLIWVLKPGATSLEPMPGLPRYSFPNGIAIDRARHLLFVAELPVVQRIDLATGRSQPIQFAEGMSLTAFDGLYFEREQLIGITGVARGRIAAFELDGRRERAVAQMVLESGHPAYEGPTTGAIAGDAIFVLANSVTKRDTVEEPTIIERVSLSPAR